MQLYLLFTISVDHFPKASKWDGINRSVSLPGSQAFCYIPSQSGKAAYLKINFKKLTKNPNSKPSFPLLHSISLKLKRIKKWDTNDHKEWIFSSKQKYMLSSGSEDLDSTHGLPLTGKLDLEQARCFIFLHNSCFSILNSNAAIQSFWTSVSLSIK